jgi:homocysteine S-methyltransferase
VFDRIWDRLDGPGVLLDGGVATELAKRSADSRPYPWTRGTLYGAGNQVLDVHRSYVAAGCDVISTNTWPILEEVETFDARPTPEWEAAAAAAVGLARRAIDDLSRRNDCAVAFCISGGLRTPRALGGLELLTWRWLQQPPDVVILETLEELPGQLVLDGVSMVADLGLPVWVSLRRAAGGMSTVDGRITQDAEPGALRRAAQKLEQHGATALLTNCVPIENIPGALSDLSHATTLPVGCLPNLGHGGTSWQPGGDLSPDEFAAAVDGWVEEGARIVGGCCGIGPDHIGSARRTLDRAAAWSARGV